MRLPSGWPGSNDTTRAMSTGNRDHVILRIRSTDAVAPRVMAVVAPIVAAHQDVAARGGYSVTPSTSGEHTVTLMASGEPSDVRYEARVRGVARGAWRVLLEAIRGELWFANLANDVDVQCSVVTDAREAWGTTDIEAFAYPVSPSPTPFRLSWAEDGPPGRAGIRLFFTEPPPPDIADAVAQFLESWQRLIRGYRPPFESEVPFGVAIAAAAVRTQQYAIELTLEDFAAHEAAFHPVVSFACWLHTYAAAIEELEID